MIFKGYAAFPKDFGPTVVAIGNFDGVHLGHRAILKELREQASRLGARAVVYTFRPHPQAALRPADAPELLTTYDEKLAQLTAAGVDAVVEEPFSREFSTTGAERFFGEILVGALGARGISVGFNFAFGRGRQGDLTSLKSFCASAGVALAVTAPLKEGSDVVSSSRIRELLHAGQIEAANALLGREFSYRGIVVKGDGRGRKIGTPTANVQIEPKLALPLGVYATRANGEPSVTNIGVRPTFIESGLAPVVVETHVLGHPAIDPDAAGWLDLYGRPLELKFLARIREERKFSGVDALRQQIAHDIGTARRIIMSHSIPRSP